MSVTTLPEQLGDAARAFAAREHQLLIGGEFVAAGDGATFETIDPATARPITSVAQAGPEDVERAVRAARRAFEDPVWAAAPAAQRALLLIRLADLVEEHGEQLAQLEALDNGKPVKLARIVDVAGTVAHLRYFAGWAERIVGDVIPVHQPDMLCYTRREPVGVAGQIIPWNFPLLMAAWKLGPALAAGCTVLLKPAEQTPLTALRIGELALEAGLPDGVVNIVPGYGETAGAALVAHPGVDKIAFTGSAAVGKIIVKSAADTLKRVTLELGGKSPNVFFADADWEAAVDGALFGVFINQGEVCSAGSRILVEKKIYSKFVEAMTEKAKR